MRKIWKTAGGILLALLVQIGSAWSFEDDEACLMCHKYPKMGRVTEDGVQKSYYIMPEVFSKTVHRNVPCRDCHNYIKELPHKPVTEGVNCAQDCHLVKNPSTGRPFSHKQIEDAFKRSVHGRAKTTTGLDGDKPYCTTCHTNPIYNPSEKTLPKKITDRCVVCHEDPKFVNKWYDHTSRRIREVKRSSQEIAQLCGNCHNDQQLVERHQKEAKKAGRELGRKFPFAVESYMNSFHGKITRYGNTQAANCLDCHADSDNYYLSVHEIRNSRDPKSPVHADKRVDTCKRCHTLADKSYAAIDPHPTKRKEDNAFVHYANIIYTLVGDVALIGLVGLAGFETLGRRRDGVGWRFSGGSSWWRRSPRGRDRVATGDDTAKATAKPFWKWR